MVNLVVRCTILLAIFCMEWVPVALVVGGVVWIVAVWLARKDYLPQSVLDYIRRPIVFHAGNVVSSAAIAVVNGIVWYTAALAMGVHIPFVGCMWAQVVCGLISKIPWTVGDIGIKEGIVAWMASVYGVPPEGALLIMVLLRSSWLLLAAGALSRPLWVGHVKGVAA